MIQVFLFNTITSAQHIQRHTSLPEESSILSYTSNTALYSCTTYILQDDDVDMVNGKINVVYYNFTSKNVITPDTLYGQVVIGVSWEFEDRGIEQLQLPNTIKIIVEYAFYGNAIESLEIPDCMIEIGHASFNNNLISEINGNPTNGIIYAKNNDGSNDSTRIVSYGSSM